MTEVRVVVVTYYAREVLPGFLDSLSRATAGSPHVVVVDNGSTDGTVELARRYASDASTVEVLEAGRNLGYGAAANLGSRGAAEDWILVANPDLVFMDGSLDALLDVAARRPEAGVLGPQIHTVDGLLYPSARELPSIRRGVGHAVFGWVWPSNPWTQAYRRERGVPVEDEVGWLSGSCLLVRREAFEAVGGFDETFFMYFEDTDLCERIAEAGWQVVYAPSATVEHQGGHSTARDLDRMSRAHHESAYTYLARHHPGASRAPLRGAIRAGLWVRYQASRRVRRVLHGATPTRRAGG